MSETGQAVFLSYASQDAAAAQRICDALRAAGVEVWFDRSELRGGDAWDGRIRRQIRECALFVPIISATTNARAEGYFRLEWKLAVDRSHLLAEDHPFLFPVAIGDISDATARVPDKFRDVQWTRLRLDETPGELAARVAKVLRGAPAAEPGKPATRPPAEKFGGHQPAWLRFSWAIVGLVFAVVYGLRPIWKTTPETPSKPVVHESPAGDEIARVCAALRPDEWTRADFDAITPTVDRLIQAYPESGDAWALRGIANSLVVIRNLDSGSRPLEVGKESADRALRLAPQSPLAELSLGLHLVAMISRGSDVLAPRVHIDRALAGLPVEPLTRYAELCSYWLGYQFEATDKSARAWLAAEPAATFPAWILAQSSVARRQPDEAARWAEKATQDPDITGVRSCVTLFEARYYLQADLAAARAAIDRVPGAQRGVHRVVASRWLLAMAEKNYDLALQEVARVPTSMLLDRVYHGPKALLAAFAHLAAGRADVAQALFKEAEQQLRDELAHDADNEELRAVLALSLACLGRPDAARRELAAVEPLLRGEAPSVYTGQVVALIAQAHGVLGEFDQMIPWLRRLLTAPSGMPFTPASLRLDPRFGAFVAQPPVPPLLAEFAALDPAGAALAKADTKSVAVLAFANLSDDKDNEYFSDGISEELINTLTKVAGLRVIARTSAFSFKGKNTPLTDIAQQLGVAYLIDGSVRKAGSQVRIVAQLVNAATGASLWSERYQRDLKDVFAVQDEIVAAIAQQFQLKLAEGTRAAPAALDPEAFRLLLSGRAKVRQEGNANRDAGIADFRAAVELSPNYAEAWAEMAHTYIQNARFGGVALETGLREARAAAAKALALDPNSPTVLAAVGWVRRTADWDWRGADQAFHRAVALSPDDANILTEASVTLLNVGHVGEAIKLGQRAVEIDPLNPDAHFNLSLILSNAGRLADALVAARHAVALAPQAEDYHASFAATLADVGQLDEAGKELALETHGDTRISAEALILVRRGEHAAARAKAAELEGLPNRYNDMAEIYAENGDTDLAFAALEKSYALHETGMAWAKVDYYLRSLRPDRRWEPFLRKMGFADDQLQ